MFWKIANEIWEEDTQILIVLKLIGSSQYLVLYNWKQKGKEAEVQYFICLTNLTDGLIGLYT